MSGPRVRILLALVALIVAAGLLVRAVSKRFGPAQTSIVELRRTEDRPAPEPNPPPASLPLPSTPFVSPSPEPVASPSPEQPVHESTPGASPTIPAHSGPLLIPVAGVRPDQLHDTFEDARAQGRRHDAIDIPAPRGTPVLAAADGTVVKLFHSVPGGTTIYQLAPDNRTVYYYAHLDRYADGLAEGHLAHQGEVIAYVGDTGDAGPGNYHLHFSISIISDPKRYWDGVNINPYPLLRR